MAEQTRHLHPRDLRFLGLVAMTGLIIVLYLATGLQLADQTGSGWRKVDLDAVMQRIETGELRELEADWYHPATEDEVRGLEGTP